MSTGHPQIKIQKVEGLEKVISYGRQLDTMDFSGPVRGSETKAKL